MKRLLLSIVFLLTGAVLMQSFQCSSREMTTGKVAVNNKDYPKAIESFEKEVARNPNNGEAYMYLADIYFIKNDLDKALEYASKAENKIKDPKTKDKPFELKATVFKKYIDDGIEKYKAYFANKDMKFVDSALVNFEKASKISAEKEVVFRLIGNCYELKNDADNAQKAYDKYLDLVKPSHDFAIEKGFYNEMPVTMLETKIGKPKKSNGYRANNDSVIVNEYIIDNKELFTLLEEKNNNWVLTGWRYDLPKNLSYNDKLNVNSFENTDGLILLSLTSVVYKKGDKNTAVDLMKRFLKLDPSNSEANASLVALYQETGRQDEALKSINALLETDPNNKSFLAQAGDMYMSIGKYDESLQYYERALVIDPNFDFVLRNSASVYKNKASVIQQTQQTKMDKDKSYKPNPEEYEPFLKKSAEMFEKSLLTERFNNDVDVLGELANIYLVLDDNKNLNRIITNLEAIESTVDFEKRELYYTKMLGIYGALKKTDKMQEIENKLNALKD